MTWNPLRAWEEWGWRESDRGPIVLWFGAVALLVVALVGILVLVAATMGCARPTPHPPPFSSQDQRVHTLARPLLAILNGGGSA